jgi:hypothetical protein
MFRSAFSRDLGHCSSQSVKLPERWPDPDCNDKPTYRYKSDQVSSEKASGVVQNPGAMPTYRY